MAITPGSIDAGVRIGEIFVDKYRVDAILGHGGMGVVALCTHLALHERVAIKMLRRDVLDDGDAVERFMREAQAAVKLKSEFVARVSDVGRSHNNVPYMVMEYLEGHDLGDLLDERGSLGLPWAVELTIQACEALAEAHSLAIVHRDIKPTNLFVTWRPDGSTLIKVLDFGISKALTGTAIALTQTQSLLGTPAYMSPEQMRSARNVDARTDIWSLGTVLYEMLEGHRPFEAESFSEMCVKVAVDAPANLTNTPLALQQVVLRCLEKAPEQRYQSMAELARALVPFSQDPHQAQVLTERMARTLRRSQVQPAAWNPSSSGVSSPVRKLASAERAAETAPRDPAASGSGPAIPASAAAITPPSEPRAAPPGEPRAVTPAPGRAGESGSATPASATPAPATPAPATGRRSVAPSSTPPRRRASRASISQTMAVVRPRRRHRSIIIAAALTAATALGVTISLLRQPAPAARDSRSNDKDLSYPRATAPAPAPKTAPVGRPTTADSTADPTAAGNSPLAIDSPHATGSPASITPGTPGAAGSADREAAGSSASTDHGGAGAAARPDPRSPTDPASRSPKTPRSTAFDGHHSTGQPASRSPGRAGNAPTQRDATTSIGAGAGSGSGSSDCAFDAAHDGCRDAAAAPHR